MKKGRLEKLLAIAVIAHLLCVTFAWLALRFVGEASRPTFFLLYLPRQPWALVGLVLLPLALARRQYRLIGCEVAALLIALFPLMGLQLHRSHAAQNPVRLLTYNVFYGHLGADRLIHEIAGARADIVVLQASHPSFAERLRAELPPGWSVRADDELILATKWKVTGSFAPEPFADASQSWVRHDLEGPNGSLQLFDVHPVSARAGLFDREDPRIATEVRARQIAAATAEAGRAQGPVVLAGDTNLPDPSMLARVHFAPFHDAFAGVGFGFGYTFPAKLPWMRIDRVLGNSKIRFLDARVLGRGASDHRALVVDFEIGSEIDGR